MPHENQDNRKLAAIMFTDMVGYSALMQKSEAHALELLDEHQKILRPLFQPFHGIEVSTIGDAFLVEFETASDSVQCAIEIQKALRTRNSAVPEHDRIQVRIGIHLGEIVHTGDTILGDGVNIAARIYPLAPPEGICISEDIMRLIKNKLELPLHKLEKTQLKNIELPVEIYSVGLPWLLKSGEPEKKGLPPITPATLKTRKIFWSLSTVAILAVLAVTYFLLVPSHPTGPNSKTIAVLPFTNMSGNAEEEYFSDGITDDILTQLCKIADLNVISRTTMMHYKGSKKTLREIGEELHAGVILEGSVRRDGNNIRITGQLIDATTDRHLWAESYDREMKSVFAIQSEIAQKIAEALQAKLSPVEKERLAKPMIANTEAYKLLLQGKYLANRAGRDDFAKAVEFYMQALTLEPNNARVWAALVYAYGAQADNGYINTEEGFAKARQAAENALRLDDKLAEAHWQIGWIKHRKDWDWMGADAEYQTALSLEPGNAALIVDIAWLRATLGKLDEAIMLVRKSIILDPVSSGIYHSLAVLLMRANQLDEAKEAATKALELNPQRPVTRTILGLVYLLQGKAENAIAEIQKEPEEAARLYGSAMAYHKVGRAAEADAALKLLIQKYQKSWTYQIAQVYAYYRDADRAFDWLDRAYATRDAGLPAIKGDSFLRNLAHDPRYALFLKKMNLPL
jgi:adenylate cyclase